MTAVMTTAPGAEILVPFEYGEYAFEYKLGWDAGPQNGAICPIKPMHFMAPFRKDAWKAGYLAHRKRLGLKTHALRPLNVGRKAFSK